MPYAYYDACADRAYADDGSGHVSKTRHAGYYAPSTCQSSCYGYRPAQSNCCDSVSDRDSQYEKNHDSEDRRRRQQEAAEDQAKDDFMEKIRRLKDLQFRIEREERSNGDTRRYGESRYADSEQYYPRESRRDKSARHYSGTSKRASVSGQSVMSEALSNRSQRYEQPLDGHELEQKSTVARSQSVQRSRSQATGWERRKGARYGIGGWTF